MSKQAHSSKWNGDSENAGKGTPMKWIHPSEALQTDPVTYLVETMNEQKLSEGGEILKVEIAISINGVAVQDEGAKVISYQYPLYLISYCADDKSEKNLISFIAKESGSSKHSCFVFASDRQAEEIALTIGQAYDLAHRRFIESSGRDLGKRENGCFLKKKMKKMESENYKLCDKLVNLEGRKFLNKSAILHMVNGMLVAQSRYLDGNDEVVAPAPAPRRRRRRSAAQVLPQNSAEKPKEKLTYNEFLADLKAFENLCKENAASGSAAEPGDFNMSEDIANAIFEVNPFGMGDFGQLLMEEQEHDAADEAKQLLEMKDGFARGIKFGHEEFSAEYYG